MNNRRSLHVHTLGTPTGSCSRGGACGQVRACGLTAGWPVLWLMLVIALWQSVPAHADTVYLEPRQFLEEVFNPPPEPQALWLTPQIQQRVVQVLEHPYRQARVRYWREQGTVVWILEEIGKEYPITAGFVVSRGKLTRARVLIYRESRGDEVRQRGFVRQFEGVGLTKGGQLDRRIDGITGATMSVDAMQRMAALALLFTEQLPPP